MVASGKQIKDYTAATTPESDWYLVMQDPNEAVAANATKSVLASSLSANVGGWVAVTDTWTYASATTITVPSGAASLYSKGTKIKLTQTTVKYFYVVGVADTVLTIAASDEYTLANAAISSISYSNQENPVGFPSQFTFSTTHGGYSSAPAGKLKYKIIGTRIIIDYADTTTGTSNATTTTFTVPVAPAASVSNACTIYYKDNGSNSSQSGHLWMASGNTTIHAATTFYDGTWTNVNAKDIYFSNFSYNI